jgi:Ser/Thr protein kinase RdoA (MazF antagonist)
VSAIVGAVLAALARALLDWLAERRKEETLREFGAARERASTNKETSDASARMAEANASPRPDDVVLGRLRDGAG